VKLWNRDLLGILPQGELHDEGTCARCGFRGSYPELYRTVLVSTNAVARICSDSVKCVRRRQRVAA
jgi:hypothetical protein